jgi:hypothetical protein
VRAAGDSVTDLDRRTLPGSGEDHTGAQQGASRIEQGRQPDQASGTM